jgi:hypothetical protein
MEFATFFPLPLKKYPRTDWFWEVFQWSKFLQSQVQELGSWNHTW